MRGRDDLDPGRGGQLALGQHPAHVVVEDLGRGARQRAEAGLAGPDQPLAHRQAGPGGPVHDLHRRERVHVQVRAAPLDLGRDVEVGGAGQVRVDAALHADLGRAGLPRLGGAVADLLHRERVGVCVSAPLRERAEPAAGVADVGEVDVPRDDVGDIVAGCLPAQPVRQGGQRVELGTVGVQQRQRLRVADAGRVPLGAAQRGQHLGRRRAARQRRRRAAGAGSGLQPGCRVDPGADLGPVPVHLGKVITPVAGAPGSVDGGEQVGPSALAQSRRAVPAAVRLLPRLAPAVRPPLPARSPGRRARPHARPAAGQATARGYSRG